MSVNSFTASGTKATANVKLPSTIFKVEISNHELLKDAYLAYLANGRQNLAMTLKRGEVRGGGKKPWRQKGTGRARFGSSRNIIWRGGGVAFGPSGNENYTRKLNSKSKKIALSQALTLATKEKNMCVFEKLDIKDSKTKSLASLLNKIDAGSRTLVVVSKLDSGLKLASRNLSEVIATDVKNLNVFDVINCSNLVITKDAIKAIEVRLEGEKQ